MFMTHKCQNVVRVWAQAHEMHNAGCEVRHARNKMHVSTQGKPHYMMAKGVLSDSTFVMRGEIIGSKDIQMMDSDADEEPTAAPPIAPLPIVEPSAAPMPKPKKKARQPLQVWWFNHWRKLKSNEGVKLGAATKELHARAKAAWSELTAAHQEEFVSIWESENDARVARAAAANMQALPAPSDTDTPTLADQPQDDAVVEFRRLGEGSMQSGRAPDDEQALHPIDKGLLLRALEVGTQVVCR